MKKAAVTILMLFSLSVGILVGVLIGRHERGEFVEIAVYEEQAVQTGSRSVPTLNINTASVDQLDSLPGIGVTLANRIIAYRTENGPFQSVEELLFVDGIGEKTLADFRHLIGVGE